MILRRHANDSAATTDNRNTRPEAIFNKDRSADPEEPAAPKYSQSDSLMPAVSMFQVSGEPQQPYKILLSSEKVDRSPWQSTGKRNNTSRKSLHQEIAIYSLTEHRTTGFKKPTRSVQCIKEYRCKRRHEDKHLPIQRGAFD